MSNSTTDPDVRFLVVRADERIAESYAYGFARVLDANPGEGYGPVTTLIVLGIPGRGDAENLAQQQQARFASGLYGARLVTTWAEAFSLSREMATTEP